MYHVIWRNDERCYYVAHEGNARAGYPKLEDFTPPKGMDHVRERAEGMLRITHRVIVGENASYATACRMARERGTAAPKEIL